MSLEKTKITYMGEPMKPEELPESDAVHIEDYFAPVTLSPHAIDMCSKYVPEDVWKPVGIYTWLQGRANTAFKKLPTAKKELSLGRLKYVFEYDAYGPVLKTIILL
jgi:hypothetical protein